MHHGGNTDTGKAGQLHAILFLYIFAQIGESILNALPDVLHMIGPHAVFQPVFPIVNAHGHRGVGRINQHRLDSRGAQLDSQTALAAANGLFRHRFIPPVL